MNRPIGRVILPRVQLSKHLNNHLKSKQNDKSNLWSVQVLLAVNTSPFFFGRPKDVESINELQINPAWKEWIIFKAILQTNLLPAGGNTCVVHAIEGIPQILAHDDGPIDGQHEVRQRVSDQNYDPLHPIDLLMQEDVHGLEGTHLLEALSHLVTFESNKIKLSWFSRRIHNAWSEDAWAHTAVLTQKVHELHLEIPPLNIQP